MRKVYVACLALTLFCTLAEAAKKFPMNASSVVPAARGEVEIDKDKNGNIRLNMNVEHLANPQNLTPAAAVYVVWLQERGGNPDAGDLRGASNRRIRRRARGDRRGSGERSGRR